MKILKYSEKVGCVLYFIIKLIIILALIEMIVKTKDVNCQS